MRNSNYIIAVLGLALFVGCGGEEWHAQTWPTTGSIMINGAAPEGAVIELRSSGQAPDTRDSRPWGVVDAQGKFMLTTYENGDGAPAGDYKVTVKWPPTVDRPSLVDRLDGAYSDPSRSPFSVSIDEGENTIEEIRITGAKIKRKKSIAERKAPTMGPPGPAMGGNGR